jgi:Cys-tRNA(Pro)/Cys-tRNA(Cys) deacylase
MIDQKPPVALELEELGIPHRVFHHEKPVDSFEQAASDRGQRPGQVVRSILFRVQDGEYAIVLAAGPEQISWKLLRKILGRSRISMASEDEVLEVTGYRVGTVGPFGLLKQARVLIDSGVMKEEEVSIGSGMRNTAVILKSSDLHLALKDAEIVDLFEGTSAD